MGKRRIILQIMVIAVLVTGSVVPFLINTSSAVAETGNPYVVRTFIDGEGNEIVMISVPGRPPETKVRAVAAPEPDVQAGINALSDVPAFEWSYGCSATSAAMLFGYYDRTGYSNMYAGPTNGGVCPLDNSIWGHTAYPDTCGDGAVTCGECPLSATSNGLDGRVINGHVDDYWIAYGCAGPDPWVGNWTEHTQGDCTADYMGTNQWKYGSPVSYNADGETLLFFNTDGSPLYDFDDYEPTYRDGCHGMRLFAESRGYSVVTNFNQLIYGYPGTDLGKGFTFADFMAEIDAGRPVIIHVEGHSMLGYGYDADGEVIYIHDTWDHSSHTMTWGGTYSIYNLQHFGVSVIRLADTEPGVLGDVNSDDTVNSTDALIILSCDVGLDTSTFCPINCGDVNGDGYVNSTDALIILSYDVGIPVPYPVGEPGCPSIVTPCPGCG
jgi:YD repeat-containing protein